MEEMISLIILAFAVSLDSFSVGFTYGIRKMKIPLLSIIVLASCSAISLLIASGIGQVLGNILSPNVTDRIGGFVLIILGAWVLYQFFRPEKNKDLVVIEKTIVNFEIKSLGIVINILRKPMSADFDLSGTITGIEAIMLGLALSLDAFGAGIGAAMLGFSPIYLAITVAIMSSIFVGLGLRSGSFFAKSEWVQRFTFIPGILLIIIGVWKI